MSMDRRGFLRFLVVAPVAIKEAVKPHITPEFMCNLDLPMPEELEEVLETFSDLITKTLRDSEKILVRNITENNALFSRLKEIQK